MAQQPQQQGEQHAVAGLFTVEQFAQRHPAFTVGAIRALRFNAKADNANGFAPAFKNVGRRVLVDERAFFACIEALQQPAKKGRRSR